MNDSRSQTSFAEEFERVLNATDTSIRRLSRLSGIPRRTLENWLYGRTQRPRHIEPLLQVARELHLPAGDADRLLQAAGYPSLAELRQRSKLLPPDLVEDWRVAPNILLGQKSAALPAQHNLPGATTPFFGRQRMCDELAAMLRRRDRRLITISGLGGAGKTRLALETARSLTGWFDHGAYFIALDNISDAAGYWEAILDGLSIPSDGVNSAQQLVEDYLRNKQILLLLDNFEHLLPHTSEISRILAKTQRLKLLVTSRQALNLQAEQLYSIGGLSYEKGQDSPAYELFVHTARRRVPDFEPSSQEATDIVNLCSYVDGLPLAVELTATWSDILRPAQILDHLSRDLHDVWHGALDRPERQKNLWDLFDYSWKMLPRPEQEAAMRLSILRGSFTPDVAMTIAECDAAVLKLLLQTSTVSRTSGSRLMIHPLVRQFLAMQAAQAGYQKEDLEKRFIAVVLNWVATETGELRQTFGAVHLQKLHAEWQHINRAWFLAVEHECWDLLDSCWDIIFYFEARGTWGQGYKFFETTRRRMPHADGRMLARLDEAQAFFASRLYDLPRSVKLARQSLTRLDELGIAGQDHAGAYARLILLAAEYSLRQSEFSDENKRELKAITAGHLTKFTDIAIALADGVKHCVQKDLASATVDFEDALLVCGSEAYANPTIRCFLAIALNGQGEAEAAREQFARALYRGLEIDMYPAVVTATYELRLLEGDDPSTQQCRAALEDLALRMGSRRTVGRVAIVNAIQYLNLGLFKSGSQMMRIGVGMVWNEVDTAERRHILSIIAQAYIAFGLIKTAPQVLSILLPKPEKSIILDA